MNIAIIGAGGVGGYIGAKLIKSGQKSTTLTARGSHLKAIEENGLTILDEDKKFTISSNYISGELTQDSTYDFIIFTTKSYDLEDALINTKKHITDETIIMTTANGVGYKDKIKSIFPNNSVLESCVYIFSNIKEAGVIKKYGGVFQLFLGSDEIAPKKMEEIFHIFNDANLETKLSKNITLQTWRKYLFISTFATMTSFYDASMGEIIKKHEDEVKEVLEEIVLLANKKDIHLTNENIKQSIFQVKNNIPYNATTSMQLDFRAKHKSELDALTGYVVNEANKLNIQVDTIKSLYKWLLIKERENAS